MDDDRNLKSEVNVLHCCHLVLDINGPQSVVDLVQDPLTLEAAAPAVQSSHDDVVRTDQHGVPAQGETVSHCLTTGGTVTDQSGGHRFTKSFEYNPTFKYSKYKVYVDDDSLLLFISLSFNNPHHQQPPGGSTYKTSQLQTSGCNATAVSHLDLCQRSEVKL